MSDRQDGVRAWEDRVAFVRGTETRVAAFGGVAVVAVLGGLVLWLVTGRWWWALLGVALAFAAGWGAHAVDRRRDAEWSRRLPPVDPVDHGEARARARGTVTVTAAIDRIEPLMDETRAWVAAAPLLELPELPGRSPDRRMSQEPRVVVADGVRYEVSEAEAVAFHLADGVAHPELDPLYTFAWTPFPAGYERSIVRAGPPRVIGTVYRLADDRTAIRWEPAGAAGGAGP
jgi:hypothetical protein